MPATSSRLRATAISLSVGTLVALSAVAIPTAANAAETCVATTTPTAQTQPWADFAAGPNLFTTVDGEFDAFAAATLALLGTVDADFTQGELDALEVELEAELDALLAGMGPVFQSVLLNPPGAQTEALIDALVIADPANAAAAEAIVIGWRDQFFATPYGDLETGVFTYVDAIAAYLQSVQDAITAATPVPASPANLTVLSADVADATNGIGDYVQELFYDGAAAQVVFTQICTTTPALAATGPSAPSPLIGAGAGLLLLGIAASAIAASRQRRLRLA